MFAGSEDVCGSGDVLGSGYLSSVGGGGRGWVRGSGDVSGDQEMCQGARRCVRGSGDVSGGQMCQGVRRCVRGPGDVLTSMMDCWFVFIISVPVVEKKRSTIVAGTLAIVHIHASKHTGQVT